MSVALDLTKEEVDSVLWGLNMFALDLKKGLRKRTDDGLNDMRQERLVELQTLANKIQEQVKS